MGISLDQYRSSIGRFNCSKLKATSEWNEVDLIPEPDPPYHFPLWAKWRLTWKQGSISLLFIILAALCQAILLERACVELNPGPPKSPQPKTREERQLDILAQLITDAPDPAVQTVLRSYDPKMTTKELKKSLNKSRAEPLTATLAFLGVQRTPNDVKDTTIDKIIVRIQALFPDKCNMCNEDYVVRLSDTPLLKCAACTQGIHQRCLAQKLGVAEVELETMTTEDVKRRINPLGLESVIYLCGYCFNDNYSEEVPPIPATPSTNAATGADSQAETDVDEDQVRRSQPRPPPPPQHHTGENSDGSDADDEDDLTTQQNSATNRASQQNTGQNANNSSSRERSTSNKPVCQFYKRGECRYGISGRGCPRYHPPLCRSLMTFGNKRPRGCTKGQHCEKFHPKMCTSSLATRECLNDSCKAYHVKGTRRSNSKPTRPPNSMIGPQNHLPPVNSTRTINSMIDPQNHQLPVNSSPHDAFLEVLNAWTLRLMDALDQKLMLNNHPNHQYHTIAPAVQLANRNQATPLIQQQPLQNQTFQQFLPQTQNQLFQQAPTQSQLNLQGQMAQSQIPRS